MRIVTDNTPSRPVDLSPSIQFPPRVKLAYAAEEDGHWIGLLVFNNDAKSLVMEALPGEMTRYLFLARMHELASKQKVELHVKHQYDEYEILQPLPF